MKKGKLIIALSISLITVSLSQTYISPGDVYGVWHFNSSPYYIQGDITIPNDSTLTIEPGVRIEFEGYYALNVLGKLLAIGTETDTIKFTINDTTGFHDRNTVLGGWNGIQFIDTPVGNDTSKIIFCSLQYGKAVGSSLPDNSGGAIFISNFDKVVISNCIITNNSSGGSDSPTGGGLSLHSANIHIENNEISHNRAWDGGGIQIWDSNPVFKNNNIHHNTADEGGGGIWVGGLSNCEFNNDIISENLSKNNGGGIICWQNTISTFDSVKVSNNSAYNGGGVSLIECEINLSGCDINDNSSAWIGGGINAYSCTIEINNTNFQRNTAYIFGGAMGIYNSELTILNSGLMDNGARILGGGIHSDFSTIEIKNTTFERDTTSDSGGAIFTWHCDLTIDNSEFVDNLSVNGGAISSDSSSLMITGSNFTYNSAQWGGGISNNRGEIYLEDCLFIRNISEHGGAINTAFSNAEFTNISFEQNHSIWGGGIDAFNTSMHIDSCLFLQNEAEENGGGIQYHIDTSQFVNPYKLEILNSGFTKNSALLRGAIEIQQYFSEISLVDVRIDKCEFIENTIDRGGNLLITGFVKEFTISNSVFTGNTAALRTATCQFSNHVSGKIYNCLFNSNYTINGGAASSLGTGTEVNFINSTFYHNIGGAALTLRNASYSTLINNIFWGTKRSTIIVNAVTDTTPCILNINYCDIQYGFDSIVVKDTVSVVEQGIGNIENDPLFLDTLNNNFRLQDTSPCNSAGVDSIEIAGFWSYCPTTDIEGNFRPNPSGSMPDIGAYESQYIVDIKEYNLSLPTEYTLFQNYPNPFNPNTTIKWQIPATGFVTLKIYDVLGKEVTTLVNEELRAGKQETIFNASHYNSGIYFYQLKVGKYLYTKKMILLK
jgi:hypothetical protein